MKKIFFYTLFLLFLTACGEEKSPEETDYNYSCVVVNMGNYTESNGSISLYDESTGAMYQEVYTQANGRRLAAIVESAVLHSDLLVLMCNNADKIVFLDAKTMREVCEPIVNIGIPRYGAVRGNYLYVSCWKIVNQQTQAMSVPHQILKINLQTKKVEKTLVPTGQPEGMTVQDNRLFVAAAQGVDVFDLNTDTRTQHIASTLPNAEAQDVLIDKNNTLWLSLGSYTGGGFLCLDAATLTVQAEIVEPRLAFEGNMALSPEKDRLFFLSADGIVGAQTADVPTRIYAINVNTKQVDTQSVVSGKGFYGFGVNPKNGNIYTANVNGFITNSMLFRYDILGGKITEQMVGVGACRFIFQ